MIFGYVSATAVSIMFLCRFVHDTTFVLYVFQPQLVRYAFTAWTYFILRPYMQAEPVTILFQIFFVAL